MAHTVRVKEGAVMPVIAQFYARELRQLIIKHKKAVPPKQESGPFRGKYSVHVYQIFEELTKNTFQ
jgi:hypothetical protein